jgi:hypothetical protein
VVTERKNEKYKRLGLEGYNNQGCLMKIIKYINNKDVIVQFQDGYKAEVHTRYGCFIDGQVKNPYYPTVYGVGMIGQKYPSKINKKPTKEYDAWKGMLRRCYSNETQERCPTYKDVSVCEEWLLYENFYEWLHEQENFEQWYDNERWAVDKDILIKGNKIYSPDTCCLVPQNVNSLFARVNANRGDFPIGVVKHYKNFQASCNNPLIIKQVTIGTYNTPEKAFYAYKEYKENLIKQIAEKEYNKGNITQQCYNAMINYEVVITD